jgi:hypothetical protein
MQEKERFALAGLGDVHPQPGKLNEPMLHPGKIGQRQRRFRLAM